jgi:hypothetical protein
MPAAHLKISPSHAVPIRNSTAGQARQILFGGRRLFNVAATVPRLFCFKLESTSRSEIVGFHREFERAPYIVRVPAISLQVSTTVKEQLHK